MVFSLFNMVELAPKVVAATVKSTKTAPVTKAVAAAPVKPAQTQPKKKWIWFSKPIILNNSTLYTNTTSYNIFT